MVKEIYQNYQIIKSRQGTIINVATLALTLFSMFSVFNAYATSVDEVAWKLDSTANVSSSYKLLDIDSGGHGISTATGQTGTLNALATEGILNMAGAKISVNEAEIVASPEVSAFHKRGLMGITESNITALIDNQPSVNEVRHFANEWIPGERVNDRSTYAAEDGFGYLTAIGVDTLWEKTRLIAYVLFVVILIAAGFMIMFRHKIGGQMAVTVFNTLPQVVMGLILVTFSFAIVGLILNLAVLLTNVIASFLDPSGNSLISVQSPLSLGKILIMPEAWSAGANWLGGGTVAIGAVIIGAIVGISATGPGGWIALGLGALIIAILILGIVWWASIRVYITLLLAYLGILLDTVLGPIILALSVFPGNQMMASEWFKRLLKNALVFPGVFLFINLGLYILKNDFTIAFPKSLTGGNFSGAETADPSVLGFLFRGIITLAFFFLAAEVPKLLGDFIRLSGGKGMGDALKGAFGKMPIIGGMFS